MKRLLFVFFLLPLAMNSQVSGIDFPSLKGELLNDKNVTIPSDCKGKFTIVCLAYSEDAETELKSWLEPVYDKYVAKTGLMDDQFDVNLYFVPMFTGAKAAAAGSAKKKIKEETQADLQPYVLMYKGDLDTYKTTLKMDDKKKPYIFLLDKTGKIIYSTSGSYTDEKLDGIDDKIE